MQIHFIGHIGSDAGGWYVGSDGKIHRIPGWSPESMHEVSRALTVIREAGQLKTPGLAEATIGRLTEFVQKELPEQFSKGGAILVVG